MRCSATDPARGAITAPLNFLDFGGRKGRGKGGKSEGKGKERTRGKKWKGKGSEREKDGRKGERNNRTNSIGCSWYSVCGSSWR